MGDVPNESGSPADHRAPRWTRAWETLGLVAREAGRALVLNQHLDTAAQLSYFAFLSILPLMLLVIVLASFAGSRPSASVYSTTCMRSRGSSSRTSLLRLT